MTLQPGDVILTGTPPGVAPFRKPPLWLKVGILAKDKLTVLPGIISTSTYFQTLQPNARMHGMFITHANK